MDWSYFWLHVGGDTLAIACVGFFIKLLLDNHFKKQERDLNDALSKEQGRFKAELDKALSSFNHRHSVFCERQEEAFAKTYAYLMECQRKLYFLGKTADIESYNSLQPEYESLHNEATLYFLGKCFYFTDELYGKVQELFVLYSDLSTLYRRGHSILKQGTDYVIHINTIETSRQKIGQMLREIRDSFRQTLSDSP